MRIMLIPALDNANSDPSHDEGCRDAALELARGGHQVTLVYLQPDAEQGLRTEKRREDGVEEHILHYKRSFLGLEQWRLNQALLQMIRSLPGNLRPEVVHIHSRRMMRFALSAKRRFRIPFVVTMHPGAGDAGEGELRSVSPVFQRAGEVVAVSAGMKELVQPLCPGEVTVIPDPVAERFFLAPLPRKEPGSFAFITADSPDNGLDAVLSAFSYAAAYCPEITLTVTGGRREYTEKQAAALGLSDKIRFAGDVGRESYVRLLSAHRAMVSGSRGEVSGAILAEALACGLPIAMTRTVSWRELINMGTGLAVPADDTHALGGAMVRLAQYSEDYDAAEIRAYAAGVFSPEAVCRRLTEVYIAAGER